MAVESSFLQIISTLNVKNIKNFFKSSLLFTHVARLEEEKMQDNNLYMRMQNKQNILYNII